MTAFWTSSDGCLASKAELIIFSALGGSGGSGSSLERWSSSGDSKPRVRASSIFPATACCRRILERVSAPLSWVCASFRSIGSIRPCFCCSSSDVDLLLQQLDTPLRITGAILSRDSGDVGLGDASDDVFASQADWSRPDFFSGPACSLRRDRYSGQGCCRREKADRKDSPNRLRPPALPTELIGSDNDR